MKTAKLPHQVNSFCLLVDAPKRTYYEVNLVGTRELTVYIVDMRGPTR